MAVFHLDVRPQRANVVKHGNYIRRESEYSRLIVKNAEKVDSGHENMPEWSESNPARFWEAAERYERANANKYREIEIALPKELTKKQQINLVRDYAKRQLGDRHAYEWAIHDNGKNPHCHLMFSERTIDGIERGPEQYFKRADSKNPQRGGCRKSTEWTGDKGRGRSGQRKERLQNARKDWAYCVNTYLKHYGHEARIDHRSYAEQGIDQIPQEKIGPKVWHQIDRENHPRWQRNKVTVQGNQAEREAPVADDAVVEAEKALQSATLKLASIRKQQQAERLKAELAKVEAEAKAEMEAAQELEKPTPGVIRVQGTPKPKQSTAQNVPESPQNSLNPKKVPLDAPKPERPRSRILADSDALKEFKALKEKARADVVKKKAPQRSLEAAVDEARALVEATESMQINQLEFLDKWPSPPEGVSMKYEKAKAGVVTAQKRHKVQAGKVEEAVKAALSLNPREVVDAVLRKALGPEYEIVREAVGFVRSLTKTVSRSRGGGMEL